MDVPAIEGINPKTGETETREANASAPFSGLVFKLMACILSQKRSGKNCLISQKS
jgi:hypothetical protein